MVSDNEKVTFEDPAVLDTLIETSDGDLRRAITYLQSASRLHAGSAVTKQSIVEIAGVVPNQVIVSLAKAFGVSPPPGSEEDEEMASITEQAEKGSFSLIKKQIEHIALEGYSGTQLLNQVSCNGHMRRCAS